MKVISFNVKREYYLQGKNKKEEEKIAAQNERTRGNGHNRFEMAWSELSSCLSVDSLSVLRLFIKIEVKVSIFNVYRKYSQKLFYSPQFVTLSQWLNSMVSCVGFSPCLQRTVRRKSTVYNGRITPVRTVGDSLSVK